MKRFLARAIALAVFCSSVAASAASPPPAFVFVNNANSTLAAPANSGATTMTLTSATNFPASIPAGTVMPLTLNDAASRLVYEIVYVTSISGTTLTVQRAQEGTAAQNWSAGDFAFVGLTSNVETGLAYGNGQTFANDNGMANAYSVSFQPALTAHVIGLPLYWKAANSNTAASTFNDGAGAGALVNPDGTALAANQVVGSTGIYETVWNGTSFVLTSSSVSISSIWSTGDVKMTMKTVADSGWVIMNDGTIGNASSGGTARANADAQNLFVLEWTNCAQSQCAVSGGRGASALTDFNANKTIALPKVLGRALAVSGSGAGLTSRLLGSSAGAETTTLTQANLPNVNFPVTDPGHTHNISNGPVSGSGSVAGGGTGNPDAGTRTSTTGISVNSGGSGTAAATLSPYGFAVNVEIKL